MAVTIHDIINFVRDGMARKRAALHDATLYDLMGGPTSYHPATSGNDWRDFSGQSLCNKARQFLVIDGVPQERVNRLNDMEVAQCALGFARHTSLRNDASVHTTGSLAEVLRDAVNKSVLRGYDEAPVTYNKVFATSETNDFKTNHVVRLSTPPTLPVWPDNTRPAEARLSDERVPLQIEARSLKLSFSWQTVVNDDQDVLSRMPTLLGDAAARTVNAAAWNVITANGTMPYDSVALFSAVSGSRYTANLITGSASPSSSTISAMTALMRLQRDINSAEGAQSSTVLNLAPRYIVCPATLATTVLTVVRSASEPAATYSAGVYNPNQYLEPVIESLLDASSTTAWYLFSDPSRCAVGNVKFLRGQRKPVTRDFVDEETLSLSYIVLQSFGVAATDHRAGVKHAGA